MWDALTISVGRVCIDNLCQKAHDCDCSTLP